MATRQVHEVRLHLTVHVHFSDWYEPQYWVFVVETLHTK